MNTKYRKKPVVIDAWQYAPGCAVAEAPLWFFEAAWPDVDGTLKIFTLEGVMTAQTGDWVIRGVKGELYLCKPDIFAATYEPA